jgi:hypothetical protein
VSAHRVHQAKASTPDGLFGPGVRASLYPAAHRWSPATTVALTSDHTRTGLVASWSPRHGLYL